ncbi:MAG: DsrE family protein, partial [Cyclobacteriaceae bacterium]|nr:DsrE family protein [Cyclobacteriaceae bacterium]
MKYLLLLCLLSVNMMAVAQTNADVVDMDVHKLVMQFTAGDSLEQAMIIGQVRNVRQALPNAQIEVVCQGPGLDLLNKSKSKMGKEVAEWTAKGVVFAACNNTMRRRGIKKEDLFPVAVVVPSALVELIKKQEQGWAYAKGGH